MKRRNWMISLTIVLPWLLTLGLTKVQAGVINSIEPNSSITLSILRGNEDVTDTWLPEPGVQIFVRVNGSINSFVLTDVSTHPGICTNFGDPTDFTPDIVLDSQGPNGYWIIPKDYGASATIVVNSFHFPIPKDADGDGIPDYWEAKNCPQGDCSPSEDIDTGPDPLSPVGDGISNFDEYRGFMVSGQFIRTSPLVKDFFLHMEDNVQCSGTAGHFNGEPSYPVTLKTFFGNNLTDLFANVSTLYPSLIVHVISENEWVDEFSRYDLIYGVILGADATTDRWINRNAVYPLGRMATDLNRPILKGVRFIECLDLSALSPLGESDKNPPDRFEQDNGNAILYTHRVVNSMLNAIKSGGTLPVAYYTFENGSWSPDTSFVGNAFTPNAPSIVEPTVSSITKIALAWYFAHEVMEHSFDVTATPQTSRKASYGYHHAEGSGTNVDLKMQITADKKANKFYIPKHFAISDEREFRVLGSQ